MISKEKKAAIMKEYARSEGDTGSPEVQQGSRSLPSIFRATTKTIIQEEVF